jgi:hypothetical protein
MTHHRNCDCYDCFRSRSRRHAFWKATILAAVIVAALLYFAGCSSTVTPAVVASQQASYDTGGQNSGIIDVLPNQAGVIITPHARDRYNGLISIYGREFLPALQSDDGIYRRADGNFDLTAAAYVRFRLMNTWHRMGREPKK